MGLWQVQKPPQFNPFPLGSLVVMCACGASVRFHFTSYKQTQNVNPLRERRRAGGTKRHQNMVAIFMKPKSETGKVAEQSAKEHGTCALKSCTDMGILLP